MTYICICKLCHNLFRCFIVYTIIENKYQSSTILYFRKSILHNVSHFVTDRWRWGNGLLTTWGNWLQYLCHPVFQVYTGHVRNTARKVFPHTAVEPRSNQMANWYDDVITWKHFPIYWPFVRRIHRSPVNSPHKGQWRGALLFSLTCAWVNNREAGDLRRDHYDVTVMSWYRILCAVCHFPYYTVCREAG